MHISCFLMTVLPLMVLASPWGQGYTPSIPAAATTTSCNDTIPGPTNSRYYNSTTTTTVSATLTTTPFISTTYSWNSTVTASVGNSTSSAGTSTINSTTTSSTTTIISVLPTESSVRNVVSVPFQVSAFQPRSEIHFSPMNARGQRFYLGGQPGSYCPFAPNTPRADGCPSGEVTAFRDIGSLYVVAPGGQQVWLSANGELGYTKAHSVSRPDDSILSPFLYAKQDGDSFGILWVEYFGAQGLMACPTDDDDWQVFAAMSNATVPSGDVNDCIGFGVITYDYTDEDETGAAAYQYN